jgi:uncharacterized repeat protein (TIGR02543 family)
MRIKLLIISLLFSLVGWSQFNISAGSTNYTQDFNGLTNGAWTDNTTLGGWYAKTDATASIATYGANTGTTTAAGLYAFGVAGTNPLSDRGLGYAPSNAFTGTTGTGKGYLGWRLKNNTGSIISSITVTWTGEEWRKENNAAAHTLSLFYQSATTVTNLTAGTWTAAPSVFTTPITGATAAAALDGNTGANRSANISVTITVNIAPGDEIMLRWEDLNDSGNDHYVAVDDVTVNASLAGSYTVTYNGNGNTGGSVPVDAISPYSSGASVTVLGNTGSLVNTGYTFNGWNTASNGTGTAYVAGNTFNINSNTTLYAQWLASSPPVITSSLAASGTQGTAFTYNIVATNSPTSYGATGLPTGLSINTATGAITGTPTVSGTFNVSISATNAIGTDTQNLVLTLAVGPCVDENFNSFTGASFGGWTSSGMVNYTTAASSGLSPNSAQFNGTGDSLTTPSFTNASELSFWIKGNGTDSASALLVQGFNGISWITIDNITNSIPAAGTTKTYNASTTPALAEGFIQFRFVYTKSAGNLAFDDVKVYCAAVTAPEMDIKGSGVSIADGDSTPDVADNTEFGSVLIASPLAKTFTIENTGIDPLKLFGSSPYITISGANASDFSVSIVPASTVAAAGSTTFEITFQPSAIGLRMATIAIANNDANESPYNFNIQGTGVYCANSTSWDGTSWSNGTPDSTKIAVLNGNYTTSVATPSFISCSLVVNAGVTLTVSSNDYVEVGHDVVNNGTVTVQDDASLIQSDNTAIFSGTGTNNMIRTAQNLKQFDYVYWSSPIVTAPFTTIANSRFYEWDTDVVNPAGYGQGNWINTADANMVPGKGYAFRVPNNDPTQTVTFTGSLFNNGVINKTINKGTITAPFAGANTTITEYDDNWNLVGNPYPSAIDTQTFATNNSAVLEDGTVYLWRHLTSPTTAANPYYQSYTYNNVSSDYVRHNGTASIPAGAFDGKIASGQGFFVKMKESLGSGSANLEFNNGQRSRNHNNSQFFRTSSPSGELQKSRIWLDLINPDLTVKTQVVAYVEGATDGEDFYFDSKSSYKSGFSFHSVNGNAIFDIQARSFPFNNNDLVPLGIQLPTTGTYTIAINQTDGVFADRSNKIYLEDKATNVIHDLTLAPYQFTAQQGINNTRFVLRYTANTLGNDDFENVSNSVKVFGRDNMIAITSGTENITSYEVYNVLGQSLAAQKNVEKHEAGIISVQRNNQALIVKVILENGHTVTRKIIF